MLTIRFARVGKRNKAQFKIMLQEATAAPGGRHVEVLGSYDPHQKKAVIKADRVKYWLSQGAKTSDTVHNLLVSQGVVEGKKIAVKVPKKETPVAAEEAAPAEAKAEEVKEEAKEEAKEEVKDAQPASEETKAE